MIQLNINNILLIFIIILIIFNIIHLANSLYPNNIEDKVFLEDSTTILYSITCHEEPLCLIDLIESCFYYNKNFNVKIVVQVNEKMSIYFKENPILIKNVYINEEYIHNNKNLGSDILIGHIKNFKYANKLNLSFNYFCLIASNCLFTKDVTFLYSEKENKSLYLKIKDIIENVYLLVKIYYKMNILCKFLEKNNCKILKYQHEGAIYQKDIFSEIINVIEEEKLLSEEIEGIPVEEILLPSIENYVYGKIVKRGCRVFWELPDYKPTIKDIENSKLSIVKRVDRKYDDKVRKHFRLIR